MGRKCYPINIKTSKFKPNLNKRNKIIKLRFKHVLNDGTGE